jgi:hypothetical protein
MQVLPAEAGGRLGASTVEQLTVCFKHAHAAADF